VLKSTEKQLRLSELSIISWVSTVEGFPLSKVPLYTYTEISYTVNFILKMP